MDIKVFGPGCARCTQVEQLVRSVVEEKNCAAHVEKISDLQAIMTAGVMSTPGLMIDGKIVSSGRIPTREEIASWIDEV